MRTIKKINKKWKIRFSAYFTAVINIFKMIADMNKWSGALKLEALKLT